MRSGGGGKAEKGSANLGAADSSMYLVFDSLPLLGSCGHNGVQIFWYEEEVTQAPVEANEDRRLDSNALRFGSHLEMDTKSGAS